MVIPRYSKYDDLYDVNGVHFDVNLFYGKVLENAKIYYVKSSIFLKII